SDRPPRCALKGPACRCPSKRLNAPYDQPCSVRRLMLSRELKLPPKIRFITRAANRSGAALSMPSSPTKIWDCGAPGLSTTITVRGAPAEAGAFVRAGGTLPGRQAPNDRSSSGKSASPWTSPATTSAALLGRKYVSCHFASVGGCSAAIDRAVPSDGYAQGCFSP